MLFCSSFTQSERFLQTGQLITRLQVVVMTNFIRMLLRSVFVNVFKSDAVIWWAAILRTGCSLKGPNTRLSKPGPPVRPLRQKELGPHGEFSTTNPGAEVPGVVAPEVAPNVSARGADDVDMGDEVAQRGVSDAESVGATNFEILDDGTARQIQRPERLRTVC